MISSALLLSLCLLGWSADSTLVGLAEYQISQGQVGIESIRQSVFRADPAQAGAWERRLVELLQRPGVSVEVRNEACRLLQPVASAECIPAIAPMLVDPATSVVSRNVLLALEDAAVLPVLRRAAAEATGLVRAGLLGDLAQRHDQVSIPAMAALARDQDPALAKAGLAALRLTGGVQATQAVAALGDRPELRVDREVALASLALGLARNGYLTPATVALAAMGDAPTPAVRGLVWQVQAVTELPGLRRELMGLLASASGDGAADELVRIVDPELEGALIAAVQDMSPVAQIRAVGVLARRRSMSAASAVAGLTDPARPAAVRLAAINALAELAGPAQVDVLLGLGADADPACAGAAMKALAHCPDSGITPALEQRLAAGGAGPVLVQAAAERRISTAIAALVPLALQGSGPARDALGRLGRLEDLESLARALDGSEDLERVVAEVLKHLPDRNQAVVSLSAAAHRNPGPARRSALRLLGLCGGPGAVAVVVGHLQDGDPADAGAALDALGRWSGPEALPPLLEVARTTTDATRRTLALRGVARLTELPGRTPVEQLATLGTALAVAREADERKLLYAVVARIPTVEAVALLRPGLTDPLVQAEAAAAWVAVARTLAGKRQVPTAKQLLNDLAAATTGDLHQRAVEALATLTEGK